MTRTRFVTLIENQQKQPARKKITINKRKNLYCANEQDKETLKETVVDFAQPNLCELGYNFTVLDIDVSKRWNSTFHMIQRAIDLRQPCDHFCNENAELLPLGEATEILCASKYPSLNKALPIYIVLIKHLKQPASQIINKVEQCLLDSLEKPFYFCAMILDPTFKITFWKTMEPFIVDYYKYLFNNILEKF
ncbi:hypothetical protein VP01_17g11 [Puccinia sorghi]|uniref:hAT-like transposase RNase-H fold domain-containing protein n=1 Tax=Puccinia sorghi TaxID=27349 RepID=A0A0L6VEF2_9BASI|nr:hypothetical protein VP01_17g11 [Puccinia sorghi]